MRWKQVQSEEELRTLGKLKELAATITLDLNGEKVPNMSWKKLYDFIQAYQQKEAESKKVKWASVHTVDDLKKMGAFKKVKAQVLEDFEETQVFIKGWDQLFHFLQDAHKAPKN